MKTWYIALWTLTLSALSYGELVPYLQTPTDHSIWITWKTESDQGSRVHYGLQSQQLDQQATGTQTRLGSQYQYHQVQLTNLAPNQSYYYRIETDQQTSEVYRFQTAPPLGEKSGKLRVLVMGDHQIRNDNRYEKMVLAAKNKLENLYNQTVDQSIDLIINDGDQVNYGTLDHYEHLHFNQSAPISPWVPIMTTVGNHEYYSDSDLSNYQAHFIYDQIQYQNIPAATDESYYAHQMGRALFLHLNSMAMDATQETWLRSVIEAASQDAQVDWIISVIHHPYQAEQYVGDISQTLRDQWMAILTSTEKHVLTISGHHHLYARGQTRDWPSYHMISGGTAWNQYWGQSTEQDFADVQKTIANWAWQIIEIDQENEHMTVESYAEAHPLIYASNGQQFHYNSRLIDRFERNLNQAAPDTPQILNEFTSPIQLPFTFTSSAFSTSGTSLLNSTHFQIASDEQFNHLEVDALRDIENFYGDTGAPLYEPVDVNAGVNILQWHVPSMGLENGSHFIRLRHRDQNTLWSSWSNPVAFEVTGSNQGDPVISTNKETYPSRATVTVYYSNGPGNEQDWVGIYKKGQIPRLVASTQWQYVSGITGEIHFANLPDGEYFVGFFKNNGYPELAERAHFYIGPWAQVGLPKVEFLPDENLPASWANAPNTSKNWLGIYRQGQTPGEDNAIKWHYAKGGAGELKFSGLAVGQYFLGLFINNGYREVADRLSFSVSND